MKDNDAFDVTAQKEALIMSINKAKLLMSAAAQKTVTDVSGDLDAWIRTMIEAKIKELKPIKLPEPLPIVIDCPDDPV